MKQLYHDLRGPAPAAWPGQLRNAVAVHLGDSRRSDRRSAAAHPDLAPGGGGAVPRAGGRARARRETRRARAAQEVRRGRDPEGGRPGSAGEHPGELRLVGREDHDAGISRGGSDELCGQVGCVMEGHEFAGVRGAGPGAEEISGSFSRCAGRHLRIQQGDHRCHARSGLRVQAAVRALRRACGGEPARAHHRLHQVDVPECHRDPRFEARGHRQHGGAIRATKRSSVTTRMR